MVIENRDVRQTALTGLVKQLINDVINLSRQHIELFKQELRDDAAKTGKYILIAVAASLIAYTGLIFFGLFLTFLLTLALPLWASALIVTILYIIVSAGLLFAIKNQFDKLKKESAEPVQEARKTLEEARTWMHKLR